MNDPLPPEEEVHSLMLQSWSEESFDEEIVALATALGDGSAASGENAEAKAVRVFNWVRNNIDYDYYYGLRKGAALTLLESSGNDFDQSALLAELLVASGYPASDVKLLLTSQPVDYVDLVEWMGLAEEPYPGKTFLEANGVSITSVGFPAGTSDLVAKQALFGWQFLNSRGPGNDVFPNGSELPSKANLVFRRMFVRLTVGSVTYDLDPSRKVYEKITAANALPAAIGYDRSSLLSAAGGTGDSNSTSGLNQTNIATHLTARTTQLLDELSGAWSGLSMEEVINGRRIVRQDVSNLADASTVPGDYYGAATLFASASDSALAGYKTTVNFKSTEAAGLDYTIATADLKGRKITLTFSGNNAELRLDDDEVADTGALGSATVMNLSITVTHPGMGAISNPPATYRKTTSASELCSYAIIYGFNASERLLAKRQERLKAYKDAGLPDDSREVRTELLNIMGLTWLRQTGICTRALSAQNNVLSLAHHRFGRMAQEAGFYVDVGIQLSSNFPDDAIPGPNHPSASARFGNVFHLGAMFASAMEHGIIEQMQPGSSAVSTVNILRLANSTSGNALYLATSSNWSTVSPILATNGYTTAQISDFNARISGGARIFLPKNAGVSQGIWDGSGWAIRSPTNAGMIISGGYSGGYSTTPSVVSYSPINTSYAFSPASIYFTPSIPVSLPPPPVSTPKFYGSDPVDMATGAFVYASEDLATGLEAAPRGLAFSRYYSSGQSARDEQNMGHGWTHNLHIQAEPRTASDEALGMGSPQQAAAFLVAMTAGADLYREGATPKEWGVAALVVGWFVDQMRDNAVSVRMGKDVFQFVAQPDGSYTPPPASTMTLGKTTNSTYFLQQRLGNTVHFDARGKASKIVDVDGREMTFIYNSSTNLDYVQDHVGRRFTFGYDGNKRITSIADSTTPSRSVSFGYDTNGNLITASDPEGKVSHFDYEVEGDPGNTVASEHRIVRLRNDDDETITQNVYDALGRVERQFLHGDTNKTFHLFYTGRDNFEVNPEGGATHYYYDERGRASGSRDAEGNVTSMTYDGQDRIVTRTSGAGETTVYTHDANHNITRIDHPRGGGSTLLDYDSLNRLDLATDPNGVQTDYVYFSSGANADKDRPQNVIHAKGTADQSTTTFSYVASGPAVGRVQTINDGDGLLTTKTYDSNGHPDVTTAPGGFVTDQNYDDRGDLFSVTDPRNSTTTRTYNKRRQVTSTVADSGGISASSDVTYDNQARVETVTAPAHNGGQRSQTGTTYSPTDKVQVEKLNTVTMAETIYDSRDWAASAKDAANRTTIFVREANGNLQEVQKPGARTTAFTYDGDRRLLGTSNPGANSGVRVEEFAYDTTSGGLPRTVKTEADNLTVVQEFDAKGQLRFLKDRKGATFEFRYGGLGRRTHVIPPGSVGTVTSYTKNGRVDEITEPSGDTATFSYNATTGRLQSVAYSGGATVNYTSYDNNGNLLVLNENGSNQITRTYDGLNRVMSYTEGGQTIGYRYYPNGKLAKLIYPGGTENGVGHVEYLYNAEGRLWQVIDKLDSTASPRVTTYGWNDDGSLDSITRPNNTVRSIGYDSVGRPETIGESAGAVSLLALGITYYPSDEIKTLDVTPAPPIRKTKAIPEVAMTFGAANRILTFNGQSVSHDDDGNLTGGPLPATGAMTSYGYDTRNRLTGAGGLTYTYNAENNRVGIGGTETTTLVVDSQSALPKVLVRTKNGVTTRYVYGVGLQYEVSSAGDATYYHYDQSGNTAVLTDQSGAVVDRITYSSYGTIRYRLGSFDTPFLYGGFFGVMTDSNGLIAMRARYYNPLTKRFLTSDPALDGLNWYAYAEGNPINFADPTGLGAASVTAALNSSLNYLGMVGGGVASGLSQGLDNFNNTVTFGLYDHLGWSNSGANTGWEHDLSRSLATIPRDVALGAGVAAAYQSITTTAASVVNSLTTRTTLQTTIHGAERIAGAAATRGGVLSEAGVAAVRQGGQVMTQADGATVRVLQNQTGRFNVVVEGERGIITTFENLSQKSLDRLSKSYGWK
ncbi:MAG: hypothetical protein IAE97_07450 [Chthoniobacterales bacterium]|nr:hypothetical protein [Chthoniobacterales bacterium]